MQTEPILATQSLSKNFGGFRAVDGVDLTVRRGGVHALIGPNGAGKTTVFNLLTKTLPPSEGRIFFKGKDVTGHKPSAMARQGMVRSFQISAVFADLTVRENLSVALQASFGHSFRFWESERSLDRLRERADELLARVGLVGFAERRAGDLPYGRKRLLELATTLALDPELLLLDEPMAGLASEDVSRVAELIRSVAADRTVLMVEHNLSVVADLSSRITVLARGKVLAEGAYAEVSADPRVIEAYIGLAHA